MRVTTWSCQRVGFDFGGRWFAWVLVLGLLGLAGVVRGQAGSGFSGRVMSVGLGGMYDATSWVPMRVRLQSPGGQAGEYRLQVHQPDLDGDRAIYERRVALSGTAPQDVWMYFKPSPEAGELDPASDLRVVLADEAGREVAQLGLPGGNLRTLDARGGPMLTASDTPLPGRLILLVGGEAGGFYPGGAELAPDAVVGLVERNEPVLLRAEELPDKAIGYEAVTAVVWQGGDPSALLAGGGDRLLALRRWVEAGGRLIVTHRGDWQTLVDAWQPHERRVARADFRSAAGHAAGRLRRRLARTALHPGRPRGQRRGGSDVGLVGGTGAVPVRAGRPAS